MGWETRLPNGRTSLEFNRSKILSLDAKKGPYLPSCANSIIDILFALWLQHRVDLSAEHMAKRLGGSALVNGPPFVLGLQLLLA